MSNILKQIRADFITARKERDNVKSAYLSSLIGDIESKAVVVDGVKTVDDTLVIATLKTYEKRIAEFNAIENLADNLKEMLEAEQKILSVYLPKQLTAEEIRNILSEIDQSNMGLMMKHLKDNYSGQYDGKLASQIAKEFV